MVFLPLHRSGGWCLRTSSGSRVVGPPLGAINNLLGERFPSRGGRGMASVRAWTPTRRWPRPSTGQGMDHGSINACKGTGAYCRSPPWWAWILTQQVCVFGQKIWVKWRLRLKLDQRRKSVLQIESSSAEAGRGVDSCPDESPLPALPPVSTDGARRARPSYTRYGSIGIQRTHL